MPHALQIVRWDVGVKLGTDVTSHRRTEILKNASHPCRVEGRHLSCYEHAAWVRRSIARVDRLVGGTPTRPHSLASRWRGASTRELWNRAIQIDSGGCGCRGTTAERLSSAGHEPRERSRFSRVNIRSRSEYCVLFPIYPVSSDRDRLYSEVLAEMTQAKPAHCRWVNRDDRHRRHPKSD